MSARPGRVVAEVAIDEPYPRSRAFRTSARFAHTCSSCRTRWQRSSRMSAPYGRSGGGARAARGTARSARVRRLVLRPGADAVGLAAAAGRRSCASRTSRTTPCPAPTLVLQTLVANFGSLARQLVVHAEDHVRRARAGLRRRRADRGAVRAFAADRDRAVPGRRGAAGHADRRDRAADPDLRREHDRRVAAVRLDRRVLPDPVEHRHRAARRRPEPARPLPPLPRHALAAPAPAAGAERACPTSSPG